MNQSCVDRGKFTWPVVLVGPRCIRLRVLLGKLDYNETDIVFNDIRNKSSTCIIVGDTQMRATTMEMELAGSSVHVKIYNKRVSTRATLINTLGHRERSFACRGCIVRVSGTILDTVYIYIYIYLNFYSPVKIFVRYTLDRKNLRTRKFWKFWFQWKLICIIKRKKYFYFRIECNFIWEKFFFKRRRCIES